MKEVVFYYGTLAYLPIYAHTVWAPYVIELGLLNFCGTFVKRFLALLMHTMQPTGIVEYADPSLIRYELIPLNYKLEALGH